MSYQVWSEREAGAWYGCVWASYLAALVIAGWTRFPLGAFTLAERKAFEASQTLKPPGTAGNFTAADVAAGARYGPRAVLRAATALDPLVATPGLVLVVAGVNARLVTRLRHWQPSYTGGHAAVVVTLGPAGLLWLDPLAPMGYTGEPISTAELRLWWNGNAVRYLAVKELALTTVTLVPYAPPRQAHFAAGTFRGYDLTTLLARAVVTIGAGGSSALAAGEATIAPAPPWAADGKVWKIANGALAGCYVPRAGITVDPAPPLDCSDALAQRDLAWRGALAVVHP